MSCLSSRLLQFRRDSNDTFTPALHPDPHEGLVGRKVMSGNRRIEKVEKRGKGRFRRQMGESGRCRDSKGERRWKTQEGNIGSQKSPGGGTERKVQRAMRYWWMMSQERSKVRDFRFEYWGNFILLGAEKGRTFIWGIFHIWE